jgi:hypothetical protein
MTPKPAQPELDVDVARWLRDEVLASVAYRGGPDDVRVLLERHDRAVDQLSRFIPEGDN